MLGGKVIAYLLKPSAKAPDIFPRNEVANGSPLGRRRACRNGKTIYAG
jgi:hypothetical protein